MATSKASILPFYISFGEESFFLDRDKARGRSWVGRTLYEADASEEKEDQILSLCEPPWDGEPIVVVIDHAEKIKGSKGFDDYVKTKDTADTQVVVVAILRSTKLSDLWGRAGVKGKVFEHKKLKTWDTNNEVLKWLEKEFVRVQRTPDEGVASLLCRLCGNDLYRLDSELRKLLLLVPEKNGVIKKEHVALVVAPTPKTDLFELADTVLNKEPKKALYMLNTLYNSQGDDANIPVAVILQKAVEKAIIGRDMLDRGSSEEHISGRVGLHPWRCKQVFLPMLKKHTKAHLVKSMGLLCELESDLKSSAKSKRTLMELTILSIAGMP